MRKLVVLGLAVVATALFTGGSSNPALAWCQGGYLYDYACASPAYRFALSPWGYRGAYRGEDAAAWAWRGWGDRGRALGERRLRWRRR